MQATDGVVTGPAERPSDRAVGAASEVRLQRVLKVVVVGLAIILFAGLALAVWRVIYLASLASQQATPAAAPTLAIRPEQSLELPAGAQVRSVSLSGNRLAVHYEVVGASGIAVLDMQSGRKVTNIAIEPKPTAR